MTAAKKELAKKLIDDGQFLNEKGNKTWNNRFYEVQNGCLYNIQYKNGKMFDVICYGR